MPRHSSISRDCILALAILVAAAAGCSDQDPIDDTPPVDTKTLWTVRAGGGGDFTDLQEGVDAASDGDTVLVGPGRYAHVTAGGSAVSRPCSRCTWARRAEHDRRPSL